MKNSQYATLLGTIWIASVESLWYWKLFVGFCFCVYALCVSAKESE